MELSRIAELAKEDPGRKFYSIAHLLTPEALYEAFLSLRRDELSLNFGGGLAGQAAAVMG